MIKIPELESMMESKLIEQLAYWDFQWIYRTELNPKFISGY